MWAHAAQVLVKVDRMGSTFFVAVSDRRLLASQFVNPHAERLGDPEENREGWIAVAALDLLQCVLVNAGELGDDAAG